MRGGDGGYYKLLGFLSVPTGFKKLEAPTRTSRHLQTSASPYRICAAEPPLLLNATIHSEQREVQNKTNKNATSHFVSVFLSFLLPFGGTLRKKKQKTQSFVWKVPFAFTWWFSSYKRECFIFGCFFFFSFSFSKRAIAPFGTKLLISICYSKCVL